MFYQIELFIVVEFFGVALEEIFVLLRIVKFIFAGGEEIFEDYLGKKIICRTDNMGEIPIKFFFEFGDAE